MFASGHLEVLREGLQRLPETVFQMELKLAKWLYFIVSAAYSDFRAGKIQPHSFQRMLISGDKQVKCGAEEHLIVKLAKVLHQKS